MAVNDIVLAEERFMSRNVTLKGGRRLRHFTRARPLCGYVIEEEQKAFGSEELG